jgi:hypothetical protein
MGFFGGSHFSDKPEMEALAHCVTFRAQQEIDASWRHYVLHMKDRKLGMHPTL